MFIYLMDLASLLLIALALSMDAFAVAVAEGMASKGREFHMALSFGIFQAFMPLIGWMAGINAKRFISSTSYLAFLILFLIGIKMIYEAGEMERMEINSSSIIFLSIATSIDAMAVGVSLSLVGAKILFPAAVIGMVTFMVSMLGFFLSKKIKKGYMAEVAGGLILMAIGAKILLGW